ncbi:MAG: 50S ribosomal protein L23 [Rhodothermales bacterium]|nr:50S ribosomal protein L23 [Rhodothermales bacterium]MBO6781421.1 50S ribosomal protein L23 [Rhodothermales bacterium]
MSSDVLIKPLVTEKLTELMEAGHYAFEVRKDANKVEIRKALESRYPGVKIKEVRTMVVRGKRRSQMTRRGRIQGKTASYKKALVTLLPDSEQIDFFEEI